jgi:type I restriction enzyme, S subunit
VTKNLAGCQVFDPSAVPPDWTLVPLAERLELRYGRGLAGNDRRPGDVDVYGSNGKVGTHNVGWLSPPGVLVGRKGTVGAVHYADRLYWPIDTVYYVRLTSSQDELRYMYYLLQYLPLRLLNAATGVPGLSRRDAYAICGVFPSRSEQAAIARVLDEVGNAIERVRAARERALTLKRALVQQLLSSGTRDETTKKTMIGPVPRSWEIVPVGAVVSDFQYGLSVAMQTKGSLPILRMGNLQQGNVNFSGLKYVSLPDRVTAQYLLRRGDVLFNRTNSQEHVGKIGIYRDDRAAVFASYLIRLHPDKGVVDPYFLGQVLNSYATQCRIKRYATPGVQQVNINATNLGRVLIPVPTGRAGLAEQRVIADTLEQADGSIRSYTPVIEALKSLELSLAHNLLGAKIRLQPSRVSSNS